jgi:hypothetical protein
MPPTKKKMSGTKIALIIGGVVLLLLCGCGGLVTWVAASNDDKTTASAGSSASPSTAPSAEESPSAEPSPSEDDEPDDSEGLVKGDCFKNTGTNTRPVVNKAPCGPQTFEVLLKIELTNDGQRCFSSAVKDDTDVTFTHDETGVSGDFVLCLKKR